MRVAVNIIRILSLATLSLALATASAVADEDQRVPAGPPKMFQPNFIFGFQARLKNPEVLTQLGAQIAETTRKHPSAGIAIAKFGDAATQHLDSRTGDELARYAATSYESTLSIVVQLQFLRMMSVDNPAIMNAIESAKVDLRGLDGATHRLPVTVAALAHSNALHLVGLEMRDRGPFADIAGRYAVDANGACPVLPATIELKQREFVVEGRGAGGNALVIYGAVGPNKAYFAINEQRFARIRDSQAGAAIDVPDRPSEMFEATVPATGTTLTLESFVHGGCTLTLSPAA